MTAAGALAPDFALSDARASDCEGRVADEELLEFVELVLDAVLDVVLVVDEPPLTAGADDVVLTGVDVALFAPFEPPKSQPASDIEMIVMSASDEPCRVFMLYLPLKKFAAVSWAPVAVTYLVYRA